MRILVVDDHEIVRRGIRTILSVSRPAWEICGEAANGEQAIEATTLLKPDVVILDITMPGMNGIEAATRIVKSGVGSRILIFTMHDSDSLAAEIQSAGAHGYVRKSQASVDLVDAIEVLQRGGTFFDRPNADSAPDQQNSLHFEA